MIIPIEVKIERKTNETFSTERDLYYTAPAQRFHVTARALDTEKNEILSWEFYSMQEQAREVGEMGNRLLTFDDLEHLTELRDKLNELLED